MHTSAGPCLSDGSRCAIHSRQTRFDQNLLTVKRYNLERYWRRSFSVAGPSLWNALPSDIRNAISLPAFRSRLKTHLFREAFITMLYSTSSPVLIVLLFYLISLVSLLFNFLLFIASIIYCVTYLTAYMILFYIVYIELFSNVLSCCIVTYFYVYFILY